MNQAIKLNPNFSAAFRDRGIVYYDKRDFDAAIPAHDPQLAGQPRYDITFGDRGGSYENRREADRIVQEARAPIGIDRYDAYVYSPDTFPAARPALIASLAPPPRAQARTAACRCRRRRPTSRSRPMRPKPTCRCRAHGRRLEQAMRTPQAAPPPTHAGAAGPAQVRRPSRAVRSAALGPSAAAAALSAAGHRILLLAIAPARTAQSCGRAGAGRAPAA